MAVRDLPTSDLIAELRRAAAVWFRNDHLLLLEELIRRMPSERPSTAVLPEKEGAP